MYDVTRWKYYSVTVFCKFRAAYNKLFGHARSDNMSGKLLEQLGLRTADTIVLCIILVFCLPVIAHCHVIALFSGLLTLLCGNIILCSLYVSMF